MDIGDFWRNIGCFPQVLNGLFAQLGIQVGEPDCVMCLGTIGILLETFAPFFNGLINLMAFDRPGKVSAMELTIRTLPQYSQLRPFGSKGAPQFGHPILSIISPDIIEDSGCDSETTTD